MIIRRSLTGAGERIERPIAGGAKKAYEWVIAWRDLDMIKRGYVIDREYNIEFDVFENTGK